jgi:hypothetical protein
VTYYVRALVSYTGTEQPVGLASMIFQPVIPNWTAGDTVLPFVNGGAGGNTSTPVGVVTNPGDGTSFGRMSPWGRAFLTTSQAITAHVHTGGSGGAPAGSWMRIAQKQVTSWIGGTGNTTGNSGIPISQLNNVGRSTLDPAFSSQLQNIEVFRYAIILGPNAGRGLIELGSPLEGFGNRNTNTGEREIYWYGSMDEDSPSIRGTMVVNNAIIAPAPAGGMVMLGAISLVSARRKR